MATLTSQPIAWLWTGLSRRPAPVSQPAIAPPFDPNDRQYGNVATTPPPEFQPPAGYDPLFMRMDFGGITLPGNYSFNGPGTDCTMVDGPYAGLVIPWRTGANSTPPTMLMAPMLIMYPRPVQDAWLTESATRDYSHVPVVCDGWNLPENNVSVSTSDLVAWAQYVQSWGNYVVFWREQPTVGDPYFQALVAARCVDFYIVGTEIDKPERNCTAAQLPAVLDQARIDGPNVPLGVHFTPNYPDGFPKDTYLAGGVTKSFADYQPWVHLCWQADQTQSAGHQAAMLYYARQRVQLGGVGGDGQPAPNARVYVYEVMATAQLEGTCTELQGKLKSLELLWAPAGLPGITGMSGFGNGASQPNGTAI